jgi:hypothetical protein
VVPRRSAVVPAGRSATLTSSIAGTHPSLAVTVTDDSPGSGSRTPLHFCDGDRAQLELTHTSSQMRGTPGRATSRRSSSSSRFASAAARGTAPHRTSGSAAPDRLAGRAPQR